MKKIIPYVMVIAIASCSTIGKTGKPIITPQKAQYFFIPVVNVKHDTVPAPLKKTMTAEQLQAYLLPFYRTNFDKLFAPKFNELLSSNAHQAKSIDIQAKSIDKLAGIIYTMRLRAIHTKDSLEKDNSYYKSQSLKYQHEALVAMDQTNRGQQQQITSNNRLTAICLVSVSILFGLIFALWRKVVSLDKKYGEILRSISNA